MFMRVLSRRLMKVSVTLIVIAAMAPSGATASRKAHPALAANQPAGKAVATQATDLSLKLITHADDVLINGNLTVNNGSVQPEINLLRSGANAASWRLRSQAGDLDFFDVDNNWLSFYIADGLNASNVNLSLSSAGLELVSGAGKGHQFFASSALLGSPDAAAPLEVSVGTGLPVGNGNSLLMLKRAGGPLAFQLRDGDNNQFWNISMTDNADAFRFSKSGTGKVELELDANGNLFLQGDVFVGGQTVTPLGLVGAGAFTAENDKLRARITELEAEFADLEARLPAGISGESLRGAGPYHRGDPPDIAGLYNPGGCLEGPDWLSANGPVHSSSTTALVVNLGDTQIEPGDFVAMAGVVAPETEAPMLGVVKLDASNRHAVVGVATRAYSANLISQAQGTECVDYAPVPGAAEPSEYLVIVTGGLAPAVRLTSLPKPGALAIGDKIALSPRGEIVPADGYGSFVTIGRVAAPMDEENGTVALFVDFD